MAGLIDRASEVIDREVMLIFPVFYHDKRPNLAHKVRQIGQQRLALGAVECCLQCGFILEPEFAEAIESKRIFGILHNQVDGVPFQAGQLHAKGRMHIEPMRVEGFHCHVWTALEQTNAFYVLCVVHPESFYAVVAGASLPRTSTPVHCSSVWTIVVLFWLAPT